MKKILIAYTTIILGLLFGIGLIAEDPYSVKQIVSQLVSINDVNASTEIIPIEGVWTMIGQVNQDRALQDLRRLTGVEPICVDHGCYKITNRFTGSVDIQWAKDYIYEQLVSLGYSVEIQDWSRSGYADQNLIVTKTGIIDPEDEIYFIAHMDGVNNSPAADDDASGVVSILELARILRGHYFNKTVVLLFSTGEEQGALGVQSYVDQLTPIQLSGIKYVVNVDMLGYDANNDGVMELWSGDHAPSLAFTQLLTDIISVYNFDLMPEIVTGCT
jgi:acetylornithine deacetylase/succinyl-diaminopimelate desuccinylase-like protein